MGRRPNYLHVTCGHDGCTERSFYEAFGREHYTQLQRNYGAGKWRCSRHSSPDEVLSPENRVRSRVLVSDGSFFGRSGYVSGPGFKAFAKDFPPGTRLRITAEVEIPE